MKKNLFVMAALAVLAVACAKEQQPSDAPAEAKKTYLHVSLEDTKVSVNSLNGVCSWQGGDVLKAYFRVKNADETFSDVFVDFTCELKDGEAVFATTQEIPAEYERMIITTPAGEFVDGEADGGKKANLVRNYVYDSDSVPVYARAYSWERLPDGSFSVALGHHGAVLRFVLHDIPAYAAGFVLSNEAKTVVVTTKFPYKTGYSEDIVLHSVFATDHTPHCFYLIDGDGDEIEGTRKTFSETRAVTAGQYIAFDKVVDFKKADIRKDYVKVCGVKWAKGNLQCKSGLKENGMQTGWRIAPYQWHHFKYNATADAKDLHIIKSDVTTYVNASDIATPANYRAGNDGNEFEHFNYGGIARRARFYSSSNFIMPSSMVDGDDICGKMFDNTDAATLVTGADAFKEMNTFASSSHNGLYGDIAYWATKGQFRMPSKDEMRLLIVEADKKYGYVAYEDYKIWGILFNTPASYVPGTENKDIVGSADTEISNSDLEQGLFLPFAGRRSNATSNSIIHITDQGVYRTGTYWGKATWTESGITPNSNQSSDPYYSWAMYIDTGSVGWQGHNKGAWDNGAGFSIRPVLVEPASAE